MSKPLPIIIAGPTAIGKTEIAIEVALQLSGEIISVDSMQVYRGMDIGTAKPSLQDRRGVPHHLIDVADIAERFDAARFSQLATVAIREIQSRNHTPILTGGTGLYFKAVTDGIGHAPGVNPQLRAELENTSVDELLTELQQRDPVLYDTIDRNNRRRVIRALEVIRQTGRPFSQQRALWPVAVQALATKGAFVLHRSPEDLRRRIDLRVEEMFRRGLVRETQTLVQRGLSSNRTATQALGYRQVLEYLEGRRSLPETIDLVKVRTRQYSKRQLTWFRRHLPARWIDLGPATSAAEASRIIVAALK